MILENSINSINSKPLILNSPFITVLVIALLYFIFAKTGFLFTSPTSNIAPIFLATGLGLASVLISGRIALIGIWIGSFSANLIHLIDLLPEQSIFVPIAVSITIATGAMIGAATASFIVQYFCKEENTLYGGKNILVLLLLGSTTYSIIAAIFGVLALTIAGYTLWENFTYSCGTWWLSDTVGSIVFTPFILAWYHKDSFKINFSKVFELFLLGGITILVSYIVFFKQGDLKYLLIPLTLGTAYHFGMRITTSLILFITIFSVILTSLGIGPFAKNNIIDSILFLDLFISVITICSLFLAGIIYERKKAEDLLKISEKTLRKKQDILQSTIESPKDISIYSLGLNYEYLSFNSLHSTNMKIMNNATIALGMKIQDCMINNEELNEAISVLDKVFLGESITTIRHFEANNSYWELRTSPIINQNKEIIGATIISTNISEKIKADEALKNSEKKYRDIFDNLQDIIFQTDYDGVFINISPSSFELSEFTPQELIGQPSYLLQADENKKKFILNLVKEFGKIKNVETSIKTKHGLIRHVSINAKLILDKDGNSHIDGIASDITQTKENEQEIANQNQKLQIQNKELEQFAYITSHDLQEPLLTLNCFTELVKEEFPIDANENIKQYLNFILESSHRMQTLVKGLLDYSRIGRQIELTKIDCNEILKDAISSMSDIIEKTNTDITAENLPIIKGYSVELIQLFQHLLGNAIKFKKKESPLLITINAKPVEDNWEFIIKDNGIGIEENNREKIFIIFKRLNNREEYPGIGIGLAICKKIVALHGGTIWAESKFGEGTAIHFTIPKYIS